MFVIFSELLLKSLLNIYEPNYSFRTVKNILILLTAMIETIFLPNSNQKFVSWSPICSKIMIKLCSN